MSGRYFLTTDITKELNELITFFGVVSKEKSTSEYLSVNKEGVEVHVYVPIKESVDDQQIIQVWGKLERPEGESPKVTQAFVQLIQAKRHIVAMNRIRKQEKLVQLKHLEQIL